MNNKSRSKPLIATLTAIVAVNSSPLMAQIEEIVVTSQRRAQNIQDVPIAVTAFSAKSLQESGVSDISQLSSLAPNVELTNTSQFLSSPSMLSGFIRGIGQDDFAANFEPGVGVYLDGVYLARSVGSNVNLLDVERIEVLKGPQGTLFGRNTIGGAISIETRNPSDEFGISGEVTLGRYDRLGVGAVVDIPIIANTLLSTIAFSAHQRDGYQKRSYFPGSGGFATDDQAMYAFDDLAFEDEMGSSEEYNLRGKLLWDLDRTRVTLSADYYKGDQSASPSTLLATSQASPSGPAGFTFVGFYNHCINNSVATLQGQGLGAACGQRTNVGTGLAGANVDGDPSNDRLVVDDRFLTGDIDRSFATGPNFSEIESSGYNATVEYDLTSNVTLKSITAYRELDSIIGIDMDGSPVAIFETTNLTKQEQLSQEFQISGRSFERFNWLVGAYYFNEEVFESNPVVFGGGLMQIIAPNEFDTKSYALFTHLNYELSDQWSLTFGGRYTEEKKEFNGGQADLNLLLPKLGVPAAAFPVPSDTSILFPPGLNKQEFENFSPKLGVEYRPVKNMMIYASYSKGFKSGGWTSRLTFPGMIAPTFDEEEADSYEVGVKSDFFNRNLQINAAAFWSKYTDIQLSIQRGISPTFENAGKAHIAGIELESHAQISDRLSLVASLGYLDAQYKKVDDPLSAITVDSDLPKIPEWAAHIGPRYQIVLPSEASINLRADYSFRSRAANDSENTVELYARSVGILNLSATYTSKGEVWSVTLGGTNVFDKRYIVNGVNQLGATGLLFGTYNRPAEWYLKVRYDL